MGSGSGFALSPRPWSPTAERLEVGSKLLNCFVRFLGSFKAEKVVEKG